MLRYFEECAAISERSQKAFADYLDRISIEEPKPMTEDDQRANRAIRSMADAIREEMFPKPIK